MTQTERTFFIIKPDGVVIPEVYSELFGDGELGLTLEDIGTTTATEELLREHYAHIADEPFFKDIVEYMTSRPVIFGILSGPNAVQVWRDYLGETDPRKASPESIRGRYGKVIDEGIFNVAHGSDSVESAEREIKLWFGGS